MEALPHAFTLVSCSTFSSILKTVATCSLKRQLAFDGLRDVIVTWDSVVSIATAYGLDERGIGVKESRYGQEFFFLHVIQTGHGVHPTS
jgi:hypothetical protein